MPKFPADAPVKRVIKALEMLGFSIVRQKKHISMVRKYPDGSSTPFNAAKSCSYKDWDLKNNMYAGKDIQRGFPKRV